MRSSRCRAQWAQKEDERGKFARITLFLHDKALEAMWNKSSDQSMDQFMTVVPEIAELELVHFGTCVPLNRGGRLSAYIHTHFRTGESRS